MIGYDYNCSLLKWQKKKKEKNEIKHHKIIRHNQACHAGVFLGRIGLASLRLYIQKAIIDLELEWTVLEWKGWGGEGRVAVERMRAGVEGVGGEKSRRLYCHTPSPLSLSLFFWSWLTPLLKIYFPPLPSTAVTIKDGGNNFHQENTVQTLANYGCNQIHSNVCLATMELTIGWLSELGKICTDWHLNLTTWHTLWRPSFHMWRPTFKDTPLPNVTSPDTVKWSSSIKSGMVSKRFKKSFTYW